MDQNSATVNPAAQAAGGVDGSVGSIRPADNVPLAKQTEPPEDVSKGPDINVLVQVAEKISAAQNVLVALSSDPSVDEMAAAIGLTLFLDKLGKRATAIYSGVTPNALEFLKPEKTFESSADALQDFVVALNKEKADHVRYKLDGDYVKIYITPYRTRISENDLGFSYGDYNVDLVIALDVANGLDLDAALREHGRIMHDAVLINITTANPGKFGGIEWSDKTASSVSEMIAKLIYSANSSVKIGKDEATAFLTGIVAATNRFSNAKTTPTTMQVASKLMDSGANQQLVSKNITPDVDNEIYSVDGGANNAKQVDATQLKIDHSDDSGASAAQNTVADGDKGEVGNIAESNENAVVGAESEASVDGTTPNDESVLEGASNENVGPMNSIENPETSTGSDVNSGSIEQTANGGVVPDANVNAAGVDNTSDLLDDLKAAEASLAQAGNEIVPDLNNKPLKINDATGPVLPENGTGQTVESFNAGIADSEAMQNMEAGNVGPIDSNPVAPSAEPVLPPVVQPSVVDAEADVAPQSVLPGQNEGIYNKPEKVVQPPDNMLDNMPGDDTGKYGKMLETALGGTSGDINPASAIAPEVSSAPEINGVPEINYMPLPGQEVLPPPPTPPIDMNSVGGTAEASAFVPSMTPSMVDTTATQGAADVAAMPVTSGSTQSESMLQPTSLGQQPAMQDQVYNPQAADPGAFKIPGM